MLTRIYWLTWLAIALTAGLVFLTGNWTAMMLVVFGFVAFGMVFIGMMNVLPITVTDASPKMPRPTGKMVAVESSSTVAVHHGARSVQA